MSLSKDVNRVLSTMHSKQGSDKGVFGEDAAFKICELFYQNYGGILIHSYEYKTIDGLEGNIKRQSGGLYVERTGGFTEIDILLVTPFRIFPIEVKAYLANKITIYDDRIEGCKSTSKCPVHQHEMHLRHLYESIFLGVPDGSTDYIVPIVVFVDKCTLVDLRSDAQKNYIHVTTLNNLKEDLEAFNKQRDFRIDLEAMNRYLKEAGNNYAKYLPLRNVIKGE